MKSAIGVFGVVLLALAGGLYVLQRPIEQRRSDWQRVKLVPSSVGRSLRQWCPVGTSDDVPDAHEV